MAVMADWHRRLGQSGFCLIALTTVLTGCLGNQRPDPHVFKEVSLPPAALPSYTPGTRYQFDNGRLETVLATENDKVTWQIGRGGTKEIRYRNLALPPLRRETRRVTIQSALMTSPRSLWPLKAGNSVRFNEKRRLIKSDGSSRRSNRSWSCSVDHPVRIATKAGQFDSFPIECLRIGNGKSMRVLESRRWFFAPSVGHYVRVEHERRRKLTKVYELVARGDVDGWDTAPDRKLAGVVQSVLERSKSHQPVTRVVEAGYRVTVTPIKTWRNGSGQYCRDYIIEAQGAKTDGSACRRGNGTWAPTL